MFEIFIFFFFLYFPLPTPSGHRTPRLIFALVHGILYHLRVSAAPALFAIRFTSVIN